MRLWVIAFCMSFLAWPATAEEPRRSNAQLKAEIIAWLADKQEGPDLVTRDLFANTPAGQLMGRHLDCMKSNASGNADSLWTLGDDVGAMMSIPLDQLQFFDNRYWLVTGCRFRSCPEASAVIIDTKTHHIHFIMIHYFVWHKMFTQIWARDKNITAYLSIFTDPGFQLAEIDKIIDLSQHFARNHGYEYEGKMRFYLKSIPEPSIYAFSCN